MGPEVLQAFAEQGLPGLLVFIIVCVLVWMMKQIEEQAKRGELREKQLFANLEALATSYTATCHAIGEQAVNLDRLTANMDRSTANIDRLTATVERMSSDMAAQREVVQKLVTIVEMITQREQCRRESV